MTKKFLFFSMVAFLLLGFGACGKSPVAINDIPAYPSATELKAGDSRIGSTLAKNAAADAALRNAAGVGGKTEQHGFSVDKDTKWDDVKKFYDNKLKSAGWGDMPGRGGEMASNILSQVNKQIDVFQTAVYVRGKQNLSVMRLVDPISKEVTLILSLTTNP